MGGGGRKDCLEGGGVVQDVWNGNGEKKRGKITDLNHYISNLKAWNDDARIGKVEHENDDDDHVGGSGGRNGTTTIEKWRRLMDTKSDERRPTSSSKFKTAKKTIKKTSRGAKSGNGRELKRRVVKGKTVSSQVNIKEYFLSSVNGNSQGNWNFQRCQKTH